MDGCVCSVRIFIYVVEKKTKYAAFLRDLHYITFG